MVKVKVDIPWDFCLGLAAAVLLLPFKWLISWCIAIFIHECSHYLAIRLLGGQVITLRLRLFGAVMETSPLSAKKEAIAAIAGPSCFILILPFVKYVPRLTLCVFLQSAFNLIPLLPLDGGRVAKCFFCLIRSNRAFSIFQKAIIILLIFIVAYISIRFLLGPAPLILVGILYFRNRKILLQSKP